MASTKGTIVKLLVVFLILSRPITLFGGGKEERPVETKVITELQDRYDALSVPGIVMLPASGTTAIPLDFFEQVEKELYRLLINAGKVKPVKMQRWLLTTYRNKVNNPFVIMNAIKAEQYIIPLQYIGKPVFFRSGSRYFFILYVYSLERYYPLIIYRQFPSLDSVNEMIASCVEELHTRLSQPVSRIPQKGIVIDEFKLEYLRLVEHSSGEFDFITAPFLEEEGMTLRDGDDFFSRMLGYILTTTNLFQTFQINDFKDYSNSIISTVSTIVDYRIKGRVQLSENECVLYVDVLDVHTGATVISIRHPLSSYSYEGVWNAYRLISVQIIEKLFDKGSYGVIPPLDSPGRGFFTNNMFVGMNTLENFVLPRGLHIISTGSNYQIEEGTDTGHSYYVLLDNRPVVYTDTEGKHIWNLLAK